MGDEDLRTIERDTQAQLHRLGYEVLLSGWPDLLVAKNGELHCVVELKAHGDSLRQNQGRVLELLSRAGIRVHPIYQPELGEFLAEMARGFEPVDLRTAEQRERHRRAILSLPSFGLRDGVTRAHSDAPGDHAQSAEEQRKAPEKACKPGYRQEPAEASTPTEKSDGEDTDETGRAVSRISPRGMGPRTAHA